jgi:hypothetical protein
MDDKQTARWGKALLIKISVITGWVLPVDELLNVLVDQFTKKLTEAYANCNTEEVEYAFRNFSSEVKDWGKNVNLSLIDEVMRPYLRRRREQSVAEEYAAPPLLLPDRRESTSNFAMLRWLAEQIRYIRTGKPVEFVPHQLYDYLDKRGKINVTNAEKRDYFQKAITYREIQLQKEWQDRSNTDNYNAVQGFIQMRKMRRFTESEYETLQRIAKKLLFFDLVKKQTHATCNPGHDEPSVLAPGDL